MESKGRINEYVCEKCGKSTVTINGEEGVTPFVIACRADWPASNCDGMSQSRFYRGTDNLDPQWEWHRPTPEECREKEKEAPGLTEHVERGGLVLRRLTGLRRDELLGSPRQG